jgi:hypothetical protein
MEPTPASASPPCSELVRGVALACGEEAAELAGVVPITADPGAVSRFGDASVDCIVATAGLDDAADPVQTLRAWRRVLAPGGTLALVFRPESGAGRRLARGFLDTLVQLVGGFECVARATPSGTPALVLARRPVAEVREPLAVLGPLLAAAANGAEECRVELLFQLGTVLLQCGEAAAAGACFERMLVHELHSPEGRFGLGMAHACAQRWREALCELEGARRIDPDNREIRRWLELARDRVGEPAEVLLPSNTPVKWSPSAPSSRTAASGCSIL